MGSDAWIRSISPFVLIGLAFSALAALAAFLIAYEARPPGSGGLVGYAAALIGLGALSMRRARSSDVGPEDRQPKGRYGFVSRKIQIDDIHRRGISITLGIVDEALCEMEQWANGREQCSVLYRESNTLSTEQRQRLLGQIMEMRATIQGLKDVLDLQERVESAIDAIRSKCWGFWEYLVELKGRHLSRYGDVPVELEQYIDPQVDRLIQGLIDISETVRRI